MQKSIGYIGVSTEDQGRGQHGVVYEHYLTESGRAVRLCRRYIDKMFGEAPKLSIVK